MTGGLSRLNAKMILPSTSANKEIGGVWRGDEDRLRNQRGGDGGRKEDDLQRFGGARRTIPRAY